VIFFANQRVEPSNDYTYDPTYRLVGATGREHLGQVGGQAQPPRQVTDDDSFRTGLPQPGDGNAMGNYTETYVYDDVGNVESVGHPAGSGSWTRLYGYDERSRIDPAEGSNRLSWTSAPSPPATGPQKVTYSHDAHGNMTAMPHLPVMAWDEQDRLVASSRQVVNAGVPETTFYSYDASGQRVVKATDSMNVAGTRGTLESERIYLGAVEVHRSFGTQTFIRETLRVEVASQVVCLVEKRTAGTDPGADQLVRYQHTNHLGSAMLELDEGAAIISYEEYFPYGSTSYQAVRSATETPKRYRYTGTERDDESGLYYHGARYYSPWLGRWTSCDPVDVTTGTHLYCYGLNNPIGFHDPDGAAPVPSELADAWERSGVAGTLPGLTGESVAGLASDLGAVIGKAIVGSVAADNKAASGAAAAVQTVFDVGGGLIGGAMDPGMVLRGIMRTGLVSAEGVEDWNKGNRVMGGAKITGEAATALATALGAVAGVRAMSAPKNPNLPGGVANPTNRAFYSQFAGKAADTLRGLFARVATEVTIQPLVAAPETEIGPRILPARIANIGGESQVVTSGGDPLITRTDAVSRGWFGKLKWWEAKSTPTARLTAAQRLGNALLERFGAIVRAQNAEAVGLRSGDVIGPQSAVRIVRPIDLLGRLMRPAAEAASAVAAAAAKRAASLHQQPQSSTPELKKAPVHQVEVHWR
jgi:RHS repeat-associated protein